MTEITQMGLTKDLYNPSFKEHIMSEFQYMIYQLEAEAEKIGAKINWATFEMTVNGEGFETGSMVEPEVQYNQHWRISVDATKFVVGSAENGEVPPNG